MTSLAHVEMAHVEVAISVKTRADECDVGFEGFGLAVRVNINSKIETGKQTE